MVCPIAQIKDCNLLFVFLSLFADNGKQKNFNKKIYLYLYQIIIKIRLLVDPFFIALDFPLKLQSNCNREAIRQVYPSSVLESCPTIDDTKAGLLPFLFCFVDGWTPLRTQSSKLFTAKSTRATEERGD
jgi:hypothetical protein